MPPDAVRSIEPLLALKQDALIVVVDKLITNGSVITTEAVDAQRFASVTVTL